jgi:hypothetical protein
MNVLRPSGSYETIQSITRDEEVSRSNEIDESILKQLSKLGFTREEAIYSVNNEIYDDCAASYWLLKVSFDIEII